MRSLARYAVTNAVTRAMLSELLTREDFEALVRAPSIREAWELLGRSAGYAALAQDIPLDAMSIEKSLREAAALRFKWSTRMLTGHPQEVGSLLLARWELDNLEFALRLWHGKDPNLGALLSQPLLVHDIPVLEIIGAPSLEDIVEVLRHTPYRAPIASAAAAYKEKRSIFYVEVALERDYYQRLLGATQALGGTDGQKGMKIVGAEIDMLNLCWLARLLEYYDVESSGVREMMIPGPSPLARRLARVGVSPGTLDELSAQFIGDAFEREGGGASMLDRVATLESAVREMAVAAARDSLAGYPFSIACVFAFYLLKRNEQRNLCTVFAGKASGLSESGVSKRLVGLG